MRFRTLLAKRDFRCLWLGQMCSQLGDRTTQTALIAIAGLWFPGSASALARVMACTVVPAFLVGPFAGACVDRWDRRRTMMVCDVARAACVMALPAVLSGPSFLPACGVILALFSPRADGETSNRKRNVCSGAPVDRVNSLAGIVRPS